MPGYPILSITDVNTTKNSSSKGKVSQSATSTQVQSVKQAEKQKTVDKKKDTQKVTSQVKDASNLIWGIIILILLIVGGYFVVKYRNVICTFAKKLKSLINN